MDKDQPSSNDHDLLIRIDEKLRLLNDKVNSMENNQVGKIRDLESGKMGKDEANERMQAITKKQDDHERRIRRGEWAMAVAIGGLMLIEFASKFVK
mgnify:CR=1 FL=1